MMSALRNDVMQGVAMSEHATSPNQDWMISFADLMAILLSFMIVGFAMKKVEGGLWKDISNGLEIAFDGPDETVGTSHTEPVVNLTSGAYLAGIFATQIPELVQDDRILELANGDVALDLSGLSVEAGALVKISEMTTHLDNPLVVSVVGDLPGPEATEIQKLVAWEEALEEALSKRAALQATGLSRVPKISVSLAEAGTETLLVVQSNRPGGAQ